MTTSPFCAYCGKPLAESSMFVDIDKSLPLLRFCHDTDCGDRAVEAHRSGRSNAFIKVMAPDLSHQPVAA